MSGSLRPTDVHIWLECNPNPKTALRETSNQIKSGLREHKARRTVSFNYPRFMLRTRPVINLVLSTIRAAERKEKVTAELQLHSDQGFQYTSHRYFKLTQSYGITPSMSRRGNPFDNALAENFFSILKTECIYRVKLQTYEQARLLIGEYIHFYNNQRIQLKTKLTPNELKCQYVA